MGWMSDRNYFITADESVSVSASIRRHHLTQQDSLRLQHARQFGDQLLKTPINRPKSQETQFNLGNSPRALVVQQQVRTAKFHHIGRLIYRPCSSVSFP